MLPPPTNTNQIEFFPRITNPSRIKKSQFVAPSLDGERNQLFLTTFFFLSYLERTAILASKNPRGLLAEIAMKDPSQL
ncbi:hypothetical protein TNCV_1664931 [Trichonephila clavipes]|uniref:Uncharacterized protein n=1 Tax=Trichonephila clavipes TaxID=2585209 RepID=A0A8X6V5V7_TRICX|nr:hypothetical protein TNCV_1664931 [Trichonephila clavipes]